MKKVIIFDMDGVLFDTIEVSMKAALNQHPGMTIKMHKELLCGNFHEEIKKVSALRKKETEQEKAERKLLYSKIKSESPMYRDSRELLEKLHKDGYIIVLNTSAYNCNCLPLLEKANILSLFDFVATAEISKSKTDKFKIIEEKYKVNNRDMLFVTDTLGDIREADIAKVSTIAVTWGAHDKSYFTREEHKNLIGIVDSFSELNNYIKNF